MVEELEFWHSKRRLRDIEAASLCAGHDPDFVHDWITTGSHAQTPWWHNVEWWLTEMNEAIITGHLGGCTDVSEFELQGYYVRFYVERDHLIRWLVSIDRRPKFFYPNGKLYEPPEARTPPYLDPEHSYHAPKLAAAIRAWQAVVAEMEAGRPLKKNPKQALKKWLDEHREEFKYGSGVRKGKPIGVTTTESIAQVANWDIDGGVPPSIPSYAAASPAVRKRK